MGRNWLISKSQAALCYETFDRVTLDVTWFYIGGDIVFQVIGTLELFFPYQKSILDFATWNTKFLQNIVRQIKQGMKRGILQNENVCFWITGPYPVYIYIGGKPNLLHRYQSYIASQERVFPGLDTAIDDAAVFKM